MLGFPLGILSAAGGGEPALIPDYELISTTVLGTTTASVTFSSLGTYSSTYKHLQVRYLSRVNSATNRSITIMRLNGDTGANYGYHHLATEGAGSVFAQNAINETSMRLSELAGDNATAGVFGGAVTDILDAYSTSKNTTIRTIGGQARSGGSDFVNLSSGLWRNTSSITSITFLDRNGNSFLAGSRFSLYGIKG